MLYGATWEMKTEYLSSSVSVKECQHVKKEFSIDWDPNKVSQTDNDQDDEDLDDFEEDDDQ